MPRLALYIKIVWLLASAHSRPLARINRERRFSMRLYRRRTRRNAQLRSSPARGLRQPDNGLCLWLRLSQPLPARSIRVLDPRHVHAGTIGLGDPFVPARYG